MELIVGGHGQGQSEWLKASRKCDGLVEVFGENCALEDIYTCEILNDFHRYIYRFAKEIPTNFVQQLMEKNPDIIIISDEIGCGIVPMDKADREWRELHGRICCNLAQNSRKVYRVICGIGNRIK